MKKILVTVLGLGLSAAPAFADGHATGDAAAGEAAFGQCKACHSIVDADDNIILRGGKNGPNLYGVYTRVAGSLEDFRYGDSLVEAGEAGLAWNEADFATYVADPRQFLRDYIEDRRARSNMSFKLRSEEDALNIWAYLVSVGP